MLPTDGKWRARIVALRRAGHSSGSLDWQSYTMNARRIKYQGLLDLPLSHCMEGFASQGAMKIACRYSQLEWSGDRGSEWVGRAAAWLHTAFSSFSPAAEGTSGLDSSIMRLKKALSFTTLRISYRRLGLLVGRPLAKLNLPQTRILHAAERLQ